MVTLDTRSKIDRSFSTSEAVNGMTNYALGYFLLHNTEATATFTVL